jgi:hypothetical protein
MGQRPGGLTVLAVLNFIFAGLGLIAYVIVGGLLAIFSGAAAGIGAGSAIAGSIILVWLLLIVNIAYCIFLVISGLGFLKQSKKKGQKMGFICGVIGIIGTIIGIIMTSSFGGMSILGIAYPLLLIILPQTVLKDGFVNP